MTPELAKAFLHQLLEYAKTKWKNAPLLVALLTGTESAFDSLIDEYLKTPAGQKLVAEE